MRNDHTHDTEHFTDMLQNENARRLGPTVEGPRCEAVWAVPLRTVCCIFPAVTWKDARLAPLLVWDTPNAPYSPYAYKTDTLGLTALDQSATPKQVPFKNFKRGVNNLQL